MHILIRKILFFSLIFAGCLSWFFFGNYWYPAATLFVSGSVPDTSSQISIQWDSGEGINGYEWERYPLQMLSVEEETGGVPVTITRTGKHNSASLGPRIVLRNIYIDSQEYSLPAEQIPSGIKLSDGKFIFKKDGAELKLLVHPKSHIRLEFPTFNGAGKVDVRIGNKVTRYDLYSSNNESQWAGRRAKIVNSWFVTEKGEFTVSMPMPRYLVQSLQVRSSKISSLEPVVVVTDDGQTIKVDSAVTLQEGADYSMLEVDQQLKRHYNFDRFLFQILFALIIASLSSFLFSFVSTSKSARDLFLSEQRYVFWLMFLSACTIFLLWHLSFWPGVMSNDSLEIWRAAQIPGMYLGDHPPLNVVFYLFLSQLWNNPAIVPFVQNFSTSLLIAYIFFSLFRRGLPIYCLVPCAALIIFSLPVGLYSIILWKDVPFALIVTLLSFTLARLYRDKRENHLPVTWKNWLLIAALTLLLAGIRHNGVLYLFIVPFAILLFGLIRIRPLVLGAFLTITILGATAFFVTPGGSGSSNYLAHQTKIYLNQAINRLSFNYLQESGKKYLGVFDVNQKNMQWDLVHLCMYGRYSNSFLRDIRWNDVYPYLRVPSSTFIKEIKGTAWKLYWKSYKEPWVYFSWNPVYMLFLYPLLPLFFRKLPMAAVFSLLVLIPMAVLVFLNILNWRYYYFAHFASYFLLPIILTDLFGRKTVSFLPENRFVRT